MINHEFSELIDKEVININDGKRLGYVRDVEVDAVRGKIASLIVPGSRKFFGIVSGETARIPWNKIERIGKDVVLVRLDISDEDYEKQFSLSQNCK